MQVKQQLERRYPNINVVGSNYPPDSNKVRRDFLCFESPASSYIATAE